MATIPCQHNQLVAVEQVSVTYPRAFQAQNDALAFETTGDAIRVAGLSTDQVVAYRIKDGLPDKLGTFKTERDGSFYAVTFAGSNEPAAFAIATESALLSPTVSLARTPGELTSSTPVDFLIISHPNCNRNLRCWDGTRW